jgi:epoxyqueuosine reductase
VLIAIGNSGDAALQKTALQHVSDASPLVRAMAVWALRRLATPGEADALRQGLAPGETDPAVLAEWNANVTVS